MNCRPEDMLVYAVTDRAWLKGESLKDQVEKALKGGVTFVQLREKNLDRRLFLEEAAAIKELCDSFHVPFVINDDVEIALASGADGVHVGQKDMDVKEARRRLGPGKIIGVSCKTVEQAKAAEAGGADYLGVGAMYPTDTKSDTSQVTVETLKAICRAVDIPVVAIGRDPGGPDPAFKRDRGRRSGRGQRPFSASRILKRPPDGLKRRRRCIWEGTDAGRRS